MAPCTILEEACAAPVEVWCKGLIEGFLPSPPEEGNKGLGIRKVQQITAKRYAHSPLWTRAAHLYNRLFARGIPAGMEASSGTAGNAAR